MISGFFGIWFVGEDVLDAKDSFREFIELTLNEREIKFDFHASNGLRWWLPLK